MKTINNKTPLKGESPGGHQGSKSQQSNSTIPAIKIQGKPALKPIAEPAKAIAPKLPEQTKATWEQHEFYKHIVRPENLAAELERLTKLSWIIEDILPSDGDFIVIFGQQKSYKSFIAIDWALSVANGVVYHGKEVEQGSVVYIAAEGRGGLLKRVEAWRQMRGVDQIKNFYPLMKAIMVTDPEARQKLNEFITLFPVKPSLVFIDTLAQSMAGDENGQGMSEFVRGVTDIIEQTGAKVIVIHHTPKGGETLRGHSSLGGALNYSYLVKKRDKSPGIAIMSCADAKDQDDKAQYFFNMRLHDIGLSDLKGKALTSLVPELNAELQPEPTTGSGQRLSGIRSQVYKALELAMEDTGGDGVTLEQWRDAYYMANPRESKRTEFSREHKTLIDSEHVTEDSGLFSC